MKAWILVVMIAACLLPAAAVAPELTGKWSGSVEVKDASGQEQTVPVFLLLKQDGQKVTGSGGPSEEEQQYDIENGKVNGNKVTFDVTAGDAVYHSSAEFNQEEMNGETIREQTNGVKISLKLALKRVPAKKAGLR